MVVPRNIPGGAEGNHENISQDSRCPGRDSNRPFWWIRIKGVTITAARRFDSAVCLLCIFSGVGSNLKAKFNLTIMTCFTQFFTVLCKYIWMLAEAFPLLRCTLPWIVWTVSKERLIVLSFRNNHNQNAAVCSRNVSVRLPMSALCPTDIVFHNRCTIYRHQPGH
jgi:hypothetical protein